MKYSQAYWEAVKKIYKNIPELDKIRNKSVLITGATGMVCSTLVDVFSLLNREYGMGIQLILAGRSKGRIQKRFQDVLDDEDYYFLDYDATKEQNIDIQVDYIIHGAGNANPAIYAKQPIETLLGNIIGLNSMLNVARKNHGSRLLYISSSEVYGNRTQESSEPFREDEYGYVDILNPRACYPNGKRTAETLCICYGQEFDVNTVIVRLGHIYGPSITNADTRASAAFTRDVVDGRDIIMKSNGAQLRSYCFTLDCASAILTVLLIGERGNAYNISNKNSIVTIREMAEELAKAGGCKVVFDNPSNEERKSYNLMSTSALSSEKIERLGWKAEFDLSEGVMETLRNY